MPEVLNSMMHHIKIIFYFGVDMSYFFCYPAGSLEAEITFYIVG